MSLLMMLAASGVRTLVTKTFTAVEAWTVPAGVARLEKVEGHGARGSTSSGTLVRQYTLRTYDHVVHPDGSTANTTIGNYGPYSGAAPADYCDPLSSPDSSGNRSQICYDYTDTSYTSGGGNTTGAAATAFGLTFPGSTGNTTPLTTAFTNVAVTPGATYNIAVPIGGILTVTYYG